ncbi:MAG: hypothetical protein ACRC4G_02100 [Alphaproteobacteria bacterium]
MEKAQKIALFFLALVSIVSNASAVISDKKVDSPRPVRPWEDFQERSRTPTDPVPDLRPSNRTGEPMGGFNEDIMFRTK